MIIWSGRGYLSVIVLFVTLFACVKIFPVEYSDIAVVIPTFVTGIFSGFFGRKWNSNDARIVVDEKTGERLKIKNSHTLFWIPMQYWGIIFSVFGIILLFNRFIILGIISALVLLGIVLMSSLNEGAKLEFFNKVTAYTNSKANREKEEVQNTITEEEKRKEELERERIRREKEDPSRFMPK